MVAIDDDFTSIPMARTVPGARVNYIKMQRLREDCVRVGRDKTDVELVSKMRGKMTGPAFVQLNLTLVHKLVLLHPQFLPYFILFGSQTIGKKLQII